MHTVASPRLARSPARSAAGGGARCDLIATCSATHNAQHATRKMQHATCNTQRAACNAQHAARNAQHTTLSSAQVLAAAHAAVVLRVSSVRAAVAMPCRRYIAVAALADLCVCRTDGRIPCVIAGQVQHRPRVPRYRSCRNSWAWLEPQLLRCWKRICFAKLGVRHLSRNETACD